MIFLVVIAAVWLFVCVLAVALCMTARGADEALAAMAAAAKEPEVEVGFVATLAEPAPVLDTPRPARSLPLPARPRRS